MDKLNNTTRLEVETELLQKYINKTNKYVIMAWLFSIIVVISLFCDSIIIHKIGLISNILLLVTIILFHLQWDNYHSEINNFYKDKL